MPKPLAFQLRSLSSKNMQTYQKIGLRVGIIGFVVGAILMFVQMGLPLLNILLAIPVGIYTGKLLARSGNDTNSVAKKTYTQASLLAGLLTALGTIIPLFVIIFMSPPGATIGKEFSKWIDPNMIPSPFNNISVAMTLGAVLSAVVIILLTIWSCGLFIGRQKA